MLDGTHASFERQNTWHFVHAHKNFTEYKRMNRRRREKAAQFSSEAKVVSRFSSIEIETLRKFIENDDA